MWRMAATSLHDDVLVDSEECGDCFEPQTFLYWSRALVGAEPWRLRLKAKKKKRLVRQCVLGRFSQMSGRVGKCRSGRWLAAARKVHCHSVR